MRANKVVGAKQTLKALTKGQAQVVFVAKDADSAVTKPIVELCNQQGVEVVHVESMSELGRACLIDVGAAVASIIK
jgi:large subunit ribosomal protein L7A